MTKKLSFESHLWLNSLSAHVTQEHVTSLITTTRHFKNNDDKIYADSLLEVVTVVNKKIIQKVMEEDEIMFEALAELMKPTIDEAFDNGFDNGFNNGVENGKILSFQNMIKKGVPREQAQQYTELSDQLVEKALAELS